MTESYLPFAACKQGIFLKSFGLFSRFWYALLEINEHSAPLSIKVRYFRFPILNTQELGFPAKLILKTGFLDSLFFSPPASSWREPTSFPDIGGLFIFILWYTGFRFLPFVDLFRQYRRWLVVLRINVDLAIFQPYLDLEAGDNQSLKIQVARPGIEPRSSYSASQELNHSATAAPDSTDVNDLLSCNFNTQHF